MSRSPNILFLKMGENHIWKLTILYVTFPYIELTKFLYARFLSEIFIFLNDILGFLKCVYKSSWKDISIEDEYKMLTKEKSKSSLSINWIL